MSPYKPFKQWWNEESKKKNKLDGNLSKTMMQFKESNKKFLCEIVSSGNINENQADSAKTNLQYDAQNIYQQSCLDKSRPGCQNNKCKNCELLETVKKFREGVTPSN